MSTHEKAEAGYLGAPLLSQAHAGALVVVVAVVGIAAFYWSGLASLLNAWSLPEYSHGYLIPIIALYLFLTRLDDAPVERIGLVVGIRRCDRGPGAGDWPARKPREHSRCHYLRADPVRRRLGARGDGAAGPPAMGRSCLSRVHAARCRISFIGRCQSIFN